MRAVRIVFGLVLTAAVALFVAPAAGADTKADRERDLERRVAELEKQNESLRQELRSSEQRNKRLARELAERRVPVQRLRPAPPAGAEVPHDWVRREFNGQPYYIIPLQQGR